ncbi:MAG: RDD family protein [Rickettsiales bacterium]|jgi:uncharacterized RDD family membrane protein YckC|nr:RDD family protein [Rickettsiales bacterium]
MADNTKNNTADGKNHSYLVTFASPHRRFLAFLIDSAIIYVVIAAIIFFPNKNDIRAIIADAAGKKELTMEIDSAGKISEVKGTIDQAKINSETYSQIKQKLEEKIKQNKTYGYFLSSIPILYNLLCLLVARKTIGQSMLNLMVIAGHDKNLSTMDILSRVCIFAALRNIFLVPFSIVLPIIFTKRRITAYDYISNTYVIEIRWQPK